jgi:hypothetical protein
VAAVSVTALITDVRTDRYSMLRDYYKDYYKRTRKYYKSVHVIS